MCCAITSDADIGLFDAVRQSEDMQPPHPQSCLGITIDSLKAATLIAAAEQGPGTAGQDWPLPTNRVLTHAPKMLANGGRFWLQAERCSIISAPFVLPKYAGIAKQAGVNQQQGTWKRFMHPPASKRQVAPKLCW